MPNRTQNSRTRNLSQSFVLFRKPKKKRTMVITPLGIQKERRRIRQSVAGPLRRNTRIEGTAGELYYNLGIDKRGLGTKRVAKRRRQKQNALKRKE